MDAGVVHRQARGQKGSPEDACDTCVWVCLGWCSGLLAILLHQAVAPPGRLLRGHGNHHFKIHVQSVLNLLKESSSPVLHCLPKSFFKTKSSPLLVAAFTLSAGSSLSSCLGVYLSPLPGSPLPALLLGYLCPSPKTWLLCEVFLTSFKSGAVSYFPQHLVQISYNINHILLQ